MSDDTDILNEIIDAWKADTGWEQFGRDVGAVLTSYGITPGTEPKDHTDGSGSMNEDHRKALDEAFRRGFDAGVEFEGQGDPSAEWPWDLPDYRYGPPTIECPHWEPGRITLRKGCTACEAENHEPTDRCTKCGGPGGFHDPACVVHPMDHEPSEPALVHPSAFEMDFHTKPSDPS